MLLKGDRVTGDDDGVREDILSSLCYLLFAHQEVVIDTWQIAKLLKNPAL